MIHHPDFGSLRILYLGALFCPIRTIEGLPKYLTDGTTGAAPGPVPMPAEACSGSDPEILVH